MHMISLAHDATSVPAMVALPAMPAPDRTSVPSPPALSLQAELSRVLGHGTLLKIVAAYFRQKRHVPSRIPVSSRCDMKPLPSAAVGTSHLFYVQLDYRDQHLAVYRYVDLDGNNFLVDGDGRVYRALEPLQPVAHARISSGWGWRTQPVLGGREFHHGIDYAAASGTPVRAAMAGTVDMVGWHGRYGRMIEVRDVGNLVTRYGHLRAFAKGIHPGSRVTRGQVIGYVGTTGLSTGPHLYYEVWKGGHRIDPLTHRIMLVAAHLDPGKHPRLDDFVDGIRRAR
jgi:murein DD-endopeptidase MepM/ murein hydrolase activator NlpD